MVLLDRSALRPLLSRAFDAFHASSVPAQECTYVVADAFEGLVERSNTLPSFWSDDLSKVWRGVANGPARHETTLSTGDVYRGLNQLAVDCWDTNKALRDVLLKAVEQVDAGSWEAAVSTLDAGLALAGPLQSKLDRLRDGALLALDK